MAFYSDSNVRTRILDPRIYVPGARATFELDASEAAYLPNLRLGLVGVTSDALAYNRLVGTQALIRSIRILDGKQELSALNEAQFYRGFQNQNKTNASAEAVSSNLLCNGVGLTLKGDDSTIARVAKTLNADTTTATTNSALINLSEYLPFLSAMTHLPTSVFKNLRVEIEMNDNALQQILGRNDTANIATLRPILIVDVLENPTIVDKLNKNLSAVQWSEVEHDQFVIPQTANDGGAPDQLIAQEVNVKLNGYNNKILDRLLMVKEIADADKEINTAIVQGYGKWSSQACYDQSIQWRVNGSNILPRNGIVGNNERLGYVVDTYGDCANYPGSNVYGMDISLTMQFGAQFLGQLDYTAIYIGQYIQDLQIEYKRVGLEDTTKKRATTSTLIAHTYGEVRKQWQMIGNNMYNISYVQA